MGDKSPKSVQKQNAQKLAKLSSAEGKKKQIALDKQAGGKKK